MDEVVEIVVNEERSKAEQLAQAYARGDTASIEESKKDMEDLNPFWTKFLQPEKYYGGDRNQELAPLIIKVLNNDQSFEETKQ